MIICFVSVGDETAPIDAKTRHDPTAGQPVLGVFIQVGEVR